MVLSSPENTHITLLVSENTNSFPVSLSSSQPNCAQLEQPEKKAVQAAAEPAHAGPAGHRSVSKRPFLCTVTGDPRDVT